MDGTNKEYGQEVAKRFIEAINNEDTIAFWNLLDRKGQGYFIGIWFFVLGDIDVNTIIKLTAEKNFLDNTLGPIVKSLKQNLGDVTDPHQLGQIIYVDDVHAKIPIIFSDVSGESGEADFIPLVLELTPMSEYEKGKNNSGINFTRWKIDTLKCIQVKKEY